MAEAALTVVVSSVLQKLESYPVDSEKMRDLKTSLGKIRDFLPLAGEKMQSAYAREDEDTKTAIGNWLRDLKHTLYEAEDLVDKLAATLSLSKVSKLLLAPPFFGYRLGSQIKKLVKELDEVNNAGWALLQGSRLNGMHPRTNAGSDQNVFGEIPGLVGEQDVVGRYEDKQIVVDYLLDTSNTEEVISVIPIVGIRGIGKTTLAILAFDDDRIKTRFDRRMWVSVPQDFNLLAIMQQILGASGRSHVDQLNMEQLKGQFQDEIDGKFFLLVLDGVCETGLSQWPTVRDILSKGARGSKIMVTTRFPEVAESVHTTQLHQLKPLSSETSWTLFERVAFRQLKPHNDLVLVGKDIVSQCKGVPFIINSVGYELCRKPTIEEWSYFLYYKLSTRLTNLDSDISSLTPSYQDLEPEVKLCFAYYALLSDDFEFTNMLDVVSLWMAQGFVNPKPGSNEDLEDIGEDHVLTLVQRSLFQYVLRDEWGNIVSFKIHNLLHDFAKQVIGDWSILSNSDSDSIPGGATHLSLTHGENPSQDKWKFMLDGNKMKKLRTFLQSIVPEDADKYLIENNDASDTHDLTCLRKSIAAGFQMSKFRSLRVLDLHEFGISTLSGSIGELIHLRYLDLSHNETLVKLPNTVRKLHNLQTLKLNSCYKLKELPINLGKLVNLRRLEIDQCDSLTFMPPGFENLSSLRTLPRYVVGRPHSPSQASSGFDSLSNLKHLRGRFTIELSKDWKSFIDEAPKSKLSDKSRLTELGIIWGSTRHNEDDSEQYQQLLEGLKPHQNLRVLQIEGYRGQEFPSWTKGDNMASVLENLVVISIEGSGECKTLLPFSRLPQLKRLTLRFMDNVQFVESSDHPSSATQDFFPFLEELTLNSFYSLEKWWNDETQVLQSQTPLYFPKLLKLKIWSCPKLISMPLSPKLNFLDLHNINKKLLEVLTGQTTRTEPGSSSSASLPDGHLNSLPDLKSLQIRGCSNLKTLPALHSCSGKLQKLVLARLDALTSLTEGLLHLTSLEELEVASCNELIISDGESESKEAWGSLSKLSELTLRELPKLTTLHEDLKQVSKLRYLCISACTNLTALPQWLCDHKSLSHLKLEGCPALTMLPPNPLTYVVKVDITECPILIKQCREHTGEEWSKIKHAHVLRHKSWRYWLMSEAESLQKPQNDGEEIVANVEDAIIRVTGSVTVSHQPPRRSA